MSSDYVTTLIDRAVRAGKRLDRAFDGQLCRDARTADDVRPVWDGDQYIGGSSATTTERNKDTMPITYNPKDAATTFPEGTYEAEIVKVEDKVSKAGNEMQAVTLKVFDDNNRSQLITEYITAAAVFKLKQLAVALGRSQEFEAGTFQADDHVGAGLRVSLIIETTDQYGDQNRIKKMLAPAKSPLKAQPPQRPATATARPGRPAAPKATSPVSAATEINPDDIPF